ncbi:MAG: hypothetical protein JWO68_3004 [Actinomycetia bacterium]|nr:hypothetical protein [Actinomycetes bacterium]
MEVTGSHTEGAPMNEQDQGHGWHPSKDEVQHIREELRPLLAQLARRDQATLTEERWRRAGALAEI